MVIVEIFSMKNLDLVLPYILFVLAFLILLILLVVFWWRIRRYKHYVQAIPSQCSKDLLSVEQVFSRLEKLIINLEDQCHRLETVNKEMKRVLENKLKHLSSEKKDVSLIEAESYLSSQREAESMFMSVKENKLKPVETGEVAYYKAWETECGINFIFANDEKMKKAINNRSSIIEPFCEKVEDSKKPEDADRIIVVESGVLDKDYNVINKVKIKYL